MQLATMQTANLRDARRYLTEALKSLDAIEAGKLDHPSLHLVDELDPNCPPPTLRDALVSAGEWVHFAHKALVAARWL